MLLTPLSAVPANLITGFLGVGKTTAIQHLLANKTGSAPWAVLVNEFGEVGIDGSLLAGQNGAGTVHIKEVPGGCMCCAAGLPMQVALNQLLQEARPERLLIEPTGLGHPQEILSILQSGAYATVLDMRATITLVDARKSRDPRYTNHDIFNQQLAVADVLIANKSDLYQADDLPQLRLHLQQLNAARQVPIEVVSHGHLSPAWLDRPRLSSDTAASGGAHGHLLMQQPATRTADLPECGFLRVAHQGEDHHSVGWRVHPERVFHYPALLAWLGELAPVRLKAVCITADGVFGLNLADGLLTVMDLDDAVESRLEIISAQPLDGAALQRQLFACLISTARVTPPHKA